MDKINLNENLSPVDESTGCGKSKPALRVACEQLEDDINLEGKPSPVDKTSQGILDRVSP